jgi:hypothetical protein
MPFLWKYTTIIDGLGHGYSETLYFEMPTRSFADAAANVADLTNKRRPLLGAQHNIKGTRLALVLDDAGAKVTRRTLVNKFFLAGTQSRPSAESNISLQVLFTSGGGGQKKIMFMAGPWRDIFPFGDALDPNVGTWQTLFNQWVAALKAAKMGWLAVDNTVERPITSYSFDPANGHTTYVFGGGGFAWPSLTKPVRLTVEFPLSKSPLDGVQLVLAADATHATTAKPRPAAPFTIAGLARLQSRGFVTVGAPDANTPAGTIQAQDPVSRKRGRPLLVSRGRVATRDLW